MQMNWLRLVPTAIKHDKTMKNCKKRKKKKKNKQDTVSESRYECAKEVNRGTGDCMIEIIRTLTKYRNNIAHT